jgi:hypothetical protein
VVIETVGFAVVVGSEKENILILKNIFQIFQ